MSAVFHLSEVKMYHIALLWKYIMFIIIGREHHSHMCIPVVSLILNFNLDQSCTETFFIFGWLWNYGYYDHCVCCINLSMSDKKDISERNR